MKKITAKQYVTSFLETMEDVKPAELETRIENFIKIIHRNRDGKKLSEIVERLEKALTQQGEGCQVHITTKQPESAARQKKWTEYIKKKSGKNVSVSFSADANILGGAIIRMNDTLYDGSLSSLIHSLTKHLAS